MCIFVTGLKIAERDITVWKVMDKAPRTKDAYRSEFKGSRRPRRLGQVMKAGVAYADGKGVSAFTTRKDAREWASWGQPIIKSLIPCGTKYAEGWFFRAFCDSRLRAVSAQKIKLVERAK